MGRVVVAHNDLHDGNILRRHENDKPGDLVFVDFGRCGLMQAGHDLGSYFASRDGG
jgi:Ser/Thr protein kinase RdoA (MazF antagonist)